MPGPHASLSGELLLNKVVLRPDKTHRRPPESLGRPFEVFATANTDTGRQVCGWYFPVDRPCAVALVNPHNRGTKAEALDHVAVLLDCGCSVVLYDYQGFGDSPGRADVRTLVGDARGVLAWLRQRQIFPTDEGRGAPRRPPAASLAELGTPQGACTVRQCTGGYLPHGRPPPLLVLGLSLGSLVAIRMAAIDPTVSGLVLDGAIEPFRTLRRSFGPLGAPVAEVACSQVPPELDSRSQIQSVACPTLFVHGRLDNISTFDDVEYLAVRTKRATLWILADCGHLDAISRHREEYRQRLRQFLADLWVR